MRTLERPFDPVAISDAWGSPDPMPGGLERVRTETRRLTAEGLDVIRRSLAEDASEFLRSRLQSGGE